MIVDEADAQLGDRSSSGDSGVGNRVFAQIAQFMGNTELRGKVIWFLLTCRPDLLPVDLKRQGRAEEHIALFYPDTTEGRRELNSCRDQRSGRGAWRQRPHLIERQYGLAVSVWPNSRATGYSRKRSKILMPTLRIHHGISARIRSRSLGTR